MIMFSVGWYYKIGCGGGGTLMFDITFHVLNTFLSSVRRVCNVKMMLY